MQPTTLFRAILACALAIGAAGTVFSQRAVHAPDADVGGAAGTDALPGGAEPVRALDVGPPARGSRAAGQVTTAKVRQESPAKPGAPSGAPGVGADSAVQRDLALLRARWAMLVEARLLAVAAGVPAAAPTPPPLHRGHLARLSEAGDLRATVHLARHPELLLVDGVAKREFAAGRYTPTAELQAAVARVIARLVVQAGDVATLEALDVPGRISALYRGGWLAPQAAYGAFEGIELLTDGSALALRARFLRAKLILATGRGVAQLEGLAARLLSTLVAGADPAIAAEAEALVWRLVHLRVGRPIPGLCGNDAFGNEVCIEDFRGRVVLMRFWSADDDDFQVQLVQDAVLVEGYWDHPFTVIGVNRDPDRTSYMARLESMGLPGNQIYDGPVADDLISEVRQRRAARPKVFDAWREASSGSTYLIDSRGVLRAIDPDPNQIVPLVRGLLDEYYTAKRIAGR